MITYAVFGYRITIRKEKKPHPMDCRAYKDRYMGVRGRVTEQLRRAYK